MRKAAPILNVLLGSACLLLHPYFACAACVMSKIFFGRLLGAFGIADGQPDLAAVLYIRTWIPQMRCHTAALSQPATMLLAAHRRPGLRCGGQRVAERP